MVSDCATGRSEVEEHTTGSTTRQGSSMLTRKLLKISTCGLSPVATVAMLVLCSCPDEFAVCVPVAAFSRTLPIIFPRTRCGRLIPASSHSFRNRSTRRTPLTPGRRITSSSFIVRVPIMSCRSLVSWKRPWCCRPVMIRASGRRCLYTVRRTSRTELLAMYTVRTLLARHTCGEMSACSHCGRTRL